MSTWSAVATDDEYCGNANIWGDLVGDCGSYHVRTVDRRDIERQTFYYDATSGELAAVLDTQTSAGGATMCTAGPATFMPPSCPGAVQMQHQCGPDGGAAD